MDIHEGMLPITGHGPSCVCPKCLKQYPLDSRVIILADDQIDISTLIEGAVIDELVATRIMLPVQDLGWEVVDIDIETVVSRNGGYSVRKYSTSHDAINEMETEIERQGWHGEYIYAVFREINPSEGFCSAAMWAIRHASPLQCCKAALLAQAAR